MSRPTILLTGARGLLGPFLSEALAVDGEVVGSARSGGDYPCDLTNREALESLLANIAPDVVVHSAGLTDVDYCERFPEQADHINAGATQALAEALPPGRRLVFISTDQVYPGTAAPCREEAVGPVNAYGRSKLAGESATLARGGSLVLRTNLFGPSRTEGRRSLSDTVAVTLGAGKPMTLFTDALFSPLHMLTLASTVAACLRRGLSGVFNLGCREGASKHDFALAVAAHLGISAASATAGRSTDMPDRAPRPLDLRLDVARIEAALGIAMPTLSMEVAKL